MINPIQARAARPTFRSVSGTLSICAVLAAPLLAVSAGAQAQAQPLPIVGGVTSIRLTSAATFAAGGVNIGVFGTTLFSPGSDAVPLVYFPITGGSLNTASLAQFGNVEHQGSGLSFSTSTATLSFRDFVIDTAGLTISAQAASAGTAYGVIPVFTLSQSGSAAAPVALAFSSAAATAFTAALGSPDLTGFGVGLANSVPITAAVPEPATALTLLAGLGLMGWCATRQRRRA